MPATTVAVTANYVPGVAPDADVSAARRWSEVLLAAIRNDFARPTVHARNLFHISSAMYDAWAAYDDVASPWLLGRSRAGTDCESGEISTPDDLTMSREEALSYAAYRIIRHRFSESPGAARIARDAETLMGALGYDTEFAAADPAANSPAALGNHIAQCYIAFGLQDGANEADGYANRAYQPVNPPLAPAEPGNPDIVDLSRWQPLELVEFIDQAGNPVSETPGFLSPEWGLVVPFALSEADLTVYTRDGFDYWVYHDPGPPPTWDNDFDDYRWSHALVSLWSSHLDPADGVMIDISPATLGNIQSYPTSFSDHDAFYDAVAGGDASVGYEVNPATGSPYAAQLVPRGDYTRVLAEFWADGPDSETPPGHWFVILNEVNDHPALLRRFEGAGPELDRLEWDVKAYFALGGAMHDAAVAAWGIKGWYDYIRPISSLRAMADLGQSSDPEGPSYHAGGLPLEPGLIEVVEAGDPLAGDDGEHVGKIKLYAWRGPDSVDDPAADAAGVGWILAEHWWPYQRPSFVTPPFAGYVSGHSTYSRAAAELLTELTGDAYFPGGMSGFEIKRNEFLVFEEGPSVDMTLQWATYRDASDQCSLSRIWGGIHPPADDIPGRLIGMQIGPDAFRLARSYFEGEPLR
ncbi:MAG: vanadium-dependent haloperoxidase [Proteobacteria bacterium]|nr:vanadium-dependent haloperoxidase [Pseudomonadota bacterium]